MILMSGIIKIEWLMVLVSSLFGYLAGSISFARLISKMVTGSSKIEKLSSRVPGTELFFESDTVSATAVSQNLGKRFGCLNAILDMVKVAIPTLVIMIFLPEVPYYLATALFGLIGHNYPVYYRFRGGRGESALLGALLIINWPGVLVTNGASLVLGYLSGSILVMRYGWYVLMIGWYWIYFRTPWHVAFMVLSNLVFWTAMSGDLRKFFTIKSKNDLHISEEAKSEFLMMGSMPGRFLDDFSLPALVRRFSG